MKNSNVIDTIRNRYAQFSIERPHTETLKFTKDDISMDSNGILIDHVPINKKAAKSLLSRMQVKPEFIELADKATQEDWEIIVSNLKNELKDQPYYAKIRRLEESDEIYSILDFPVYDKVEPISNDVYIDAICTELENTKDSYKLFETTFDKETNKIIIGLINEDTQFSIFDGSGQDSHDIWMSGVKFEFTETQFTSRHLLERLICSNGMTTKDESFVGHINKKNFNQDKIQNAITKAFQEPFKQIFERVEKQVNILKQHEISVKEFYDYTKILFREAKKLKIIDDVKAIFDDSVFYSTYGLNVKEQSYKWQSSAKTGLSAYNFFNALTYTATHIFAESSPSVAAEMQLKISKFFFKELFDIDEVAPTADIDYNTTHIAFK